MRLSVCRGDFAIRIRERFVWRAGFPGRASSGPCRRFAGSFGRAAVRAVSRGASSRPGSGGSGGRPVAGRAFAPLVSVAVGTEVAAPLPHSCRDSVGVSSCFCRMLAGLLPGLLRGACRGSVGFLPGSCRVFGYCRSDSGRRPLRRIVGAAPAMPAVRRRPHAADGTRPERLRVCLPPAPDAREHPARGGIGAPPSNRRRPDRRRRTARHFPCLRDGGRRPRPAERGPERASPCRRWLRPERIGSAADRRGARRHGSGVFAGPGAAPVPSGDCRGGQTTAKKRTFRGAERRFVRSALRVADIFSIFACYCA